MAIKFYILRFTDLFLLHIFLQIARVTAEFTTTLKWISNCYQQVLLNIAPLQNCAERRTDL